MGGWSWDDDEGTTVDRHEAAFSAAQLQRVNQLIRQGLASGGAVELSVALLCELNGLALTGDSSQGRLRIKDNELPGIRHIPPTTSEVPAHLEDFVRQVKTWQSDAIELAAFVLWRINWIHPFDDGNGRTARAASYLVLNLAIGYELPGQTTLVERIQWERTAYYYALEEADRAWAGGKLDVSVLAAMIRRLVEAQIRERV